jgi:Tfp pilus assembly protein PilF
VVLETTAKPARDEKAVLGYYSWGASDPENRVRSVGMGFAPGSIAANLASFDARTFHQPPDDWSPTALPDKATWFEGSGDALIGDLIREGVTGISGQVGEAYMLGAVRPEILFPAYLAGFNLAEAFYLAVPTLSWQTVVVGDPLCAPFGRKPLAGEQLEDGTDAMTGLPGIFAKRRLTALLAANQEVSEAAAPLVVRFQTLLERDDQVGARRALEEALRLAPRAVGLMIILAQFEEQLGDDVAAIARYRRILEVQPANVIALNNLAFALAVRHNAAAEALSLARRAVGLAPRSGTVLDTLAWVEHLLGNNDVAASLFGQAIQFEPSQAEIRLHAAIAYLANGKSDRAEAELKEALRLDSALEGRDEVRQLEERIAAFKPTTPR